MFQLQSVVDLPLVHGQVVGVDDPEPVERSQVLTGLLELQRQRDGHEVKDLPQVCRNILRLYSRGDRFPSPIEEREQVTLGVLLGDLEGFGDLGCQRKVSAGGFGSIVGVQRVQVILGQSPGQFGGQFRVGS